MLVAVSIRMGDHTWYGKFILLCNEPTTSTHPGHIKRVGEICTCQRAVMLWSERRYGSCLVATLFSIVKTHAESESYSSCYKAV